MSHLPIRPFPSRLPIRPFFLGFFYFERSVLKLFFGLKNNFL
jgi:hypothetical protein